MTKTPEEIDKELDDLLIYVQEVESRVVRGEGVDLSGLDARVSEICIAVENSAPDQAKKAEDKLAALVEKLDSLARVIKNQFDGLADQAGLTNGTGDNEGQD